MKSIELSGMWWLPSCEEHKVAGTLTFSNEDGIRLALIGSLKEIHEALLAKPYTLILGMTNKGKLITLCECIESATNMSFPGFMTQELMATHAYIGTHFTDPQEILFSAAEVQFSYLPDWIFTTHEHQPQWNIKNECGLRKYELAYTYPEQLRATTCKGSVSIIHSLHPSGDLVQGINLQQEVSMLIEVREEISFSELNSQLIHPLRNLLTLATGRPNSLINIILYSKQITTTLPNNKTIETPIQTIFSTLFHETERQKQLYKDDMLFTLQDIISDFDVIIEKWLNVAEKLDSVCNLFFSIEYSPKMYLEHRFLNIVQAVESYHRRQFSNQIVQEKEHKSRIDSILDQTPENLKPWLVERLKYSNEPTLRHRIRELMNLAGEALSPLAPDKKAFIRKVVDTRNFLVHYDSSVRGKAADSSELRQLTETLSFLLQICFPRELALTSECYTDLIRRTKRYRFAIQQAQKKR